MLYSDFEKLQAAYNFKCTENSQLQIRVSELEEEVNRLKEILKLQQNSLFGKSSETSHALNLTEPPTDDTATNNTTEEPRGNGKERTTTVSSHTRTIKPRGSRQLDANKLPRYKIVHDLPAAEQNCACCGKPLHVIGQDISEQLEIIPVQYCIIEHIRLKYGCRPCESVMMAPKPPAPLPKAIAGPSLLTDVILNKYQYHLPLYRQSKILQSHAVRISDKTLANWVIQSGKAIWPVYEAIWGILQQRYLQVDETPVKVLETNKNGYVWTYFAPNAGKGLVAFDFSLSRESKNVQERLKNFKGLLQTDGYAGYDALRKRDNITGFGCLSHARRKFSEVVKVSKDKYAHGVAAEMIKRLKPLFELEERMRNIADMHHRTRKRLRQKISAPILKEIYKWLKSINDKALPKSKLGKAIQYTIKQWPYLITYTKHGMAEIDTNYVENKIREIALGRKNWLFMGNEDCGKIHAMWYTLIISAIINEINPRVYIHYLLTKVHDLRRKDIEPASLLPDRINSKILQDFANEQVEFGKKILNNLDSS